MVLLQDTLLIGAQLVDRDILRSKNTLLQRLQKVVQAWVYVKGSSVHVILWGGVEVPQRYEIALYGNMSWSKSKRSTLQCISDTLLVTKGMRRILSSRDIQWFVLEYPERV
jgi:hypothetical protein